MALPGIQRGHGCGRVQLQVLTEFSVDEPKVGDVLGRQFRLDFAVVDAENGAPLSCLQLEAIGRFFDAVLAAALKDALALDIRATAGDIQQFASGFGQG